MSYREEKVSFNLEVKDEIKSLKVWNVNSQLKQEEQVDRLNVREHFLSTGFINDPNKKSHLEISFKDESKAEELQSVLEKYGFQFKIVMRSGKYLLYSKDGEEICNFLALIGVNKAVLKFEEIRVLKETRNNINRVINCENANLDKIIKSSVEQIEPKFIDTNCKAYKNGHNHVIKFSENLPYTIDETDTEIVFKIYNPFVNGNDIYTINVAKTEKYSYKINLKNGEYTLKVNYLIPNKENPLKDLTFLIDAGHGGHENGAIGCFGEKEKNINLEIATELKKLLAEQGAYTVMTRECDAYVSLNDRIKLAQEYAAHIFISIHLNSIGDIDMNIHKHRGVGVFYYNLNSRDLANSVEKTLANGLNLKKDGVHRASFAVIRPTDYIGILVEAAYMTNPLDSMIYRADDFAQNAAKGILEGIINYLSE